MGSGSSTNKTRKGVVWKKEVKTMLDQYQKQIKTKDSTIRFLKHRCIELQKEASRFEPQSAQKAFTETLEDFIKNLEMKVDEKNAIIRNLERTLVSIGEQAGSGVPVDPAIARLRDRWDSRESESSDDFPAQRHAAEKDRFAISGEAFTAAKLNKNMVGKTKEDVEFIKRSLLKSNFLGGLDDDQLFELVGCMSIKHISSGKDIIRQDDLGDMMYLLKMGEVDIYLRRDEKNNYITTLKPGAIFGELAILYNCKRTATCRAKTDVTLWAVDRQSVQTVVTVLGQKRVEGYLQVLKTVNKLKSLPISALSKIADCLESQNYRKGEYIIREGTAGDIFYIIREGKVNVTQDVDGIEELMAELGPGEYFGERALMSEDLRSANIVAQTKTVTLLTLERQLFSSLIGNLDELQDYEVSEREVTDEDAIYDDIMKTIRAIEEKSFKVLTPNSKDRQLIDSTPFKQLQMVSVLGQGGFGFVKLCKIPGLSKSSFALKAIKKAQIIKQGQMKHVTDERNIQISLKSPFCGRLYRTFKDELKIYFLMDSYLGGELYGVLRKVGALRDSAARFCAGCCLEALSYLHDRDIVYRDLKPENLMVDHRGYVVLIDFGFAKQIPEGTKTWTFCGTPEYFPPEVLSNAGHDISADYWSFGILIYELLTLTTPFYSPDDIMIYENILGGIERIKFSAKVKKQAENLIRSLCKIEPPLRLGNMKGGVNDIRKHRWFQSFDWEGLRSCKLESPFDPDVQGPLDVKHFPRIPFSASIDIPEERSTLLKANMDWDKVFG